MRFAGLVFIALALAACSRPASAPPPAGEAPADAPPAAEQPVAAVPAAPPAAAPEPTETVGGDGSEIVLNPLAATDLEGVTLDGELACSFSASGSSPLVLARGDVASADPAFGVIKVGDYVERISAPRGYNGMLNGATFSGQGKTVTIALKGALNGAARAGGESPPRPATLTYDRADGAKRVYLGVWTCGP